MHRYVLLPNSCRTREGAFGWNHYQVEGLISKTGKTNKEYLLELNSCARSWLTELEQSITVVLIKGSVLDSELTPDFGIKRLKKAAGHIDREVVITRIKKWSILFTHPSDRAGYDTRSIFKRSLTSLNSEFSFS